MQNFPPRKEPFLTDDLKAISIHAPWAWAILAGYKRVENRSWTTPHRGLLAIHAGRSAASDATATALFDTLGILYPQEFSRGKILGTVDLVEILSLDEYVEKFGGDATNRAMAQGPWCWVLANPREGEPLSCPGALGLWNVAAALRRTVG